jgi:hypothetical protein
LGIIITKIVQEENTVGVVIEGGYLARAFMLGQMNSNYLNLLVQQSMNDLHLLTFKGNFWNKQKSYFSITYHGRWSFVLIAY